MAVNICEQNVDRHATLVVGTEEQYTHTVEAAKFLGVW